MLTRVVGALVLPLRLLATRAGTLAVLDYEADAWVDRLDLEPLLRYSTAERFAWLVFRYPEFRNLVHFRLRSLPLPLRLLAEAVYRPIDGLHLDSPAIGRGLVIQHGFATTVSAEAIGEDCWINQQVTIGWSGKGRPTLGDRVRVASGAVLIGAIVIGDGARIGANATVMHDVPAGAHMIAPLAVERRQAVAVVDPIVDESPLRADQHPAA